MIRFSMSVKNHRQKIKYTQEQLAAACGVSRQAVAKWESGAVLPGMEKILLLAQIFHISTDELLTGEQALPETSQKSGSQNHYIENEKIVNLALKSSMTREDPEEEIRQFISDIGSRIGCGRIGIFEAEPDGSYKNTYEWCSRGLLPQIEYLQNIPLEDLSSWLDAFSREESVFIEKVDGIADSDPKIYRWLKPQEIESLLAYPLFGGRSFVAVDDPAPAFIAQTSSLIEIMVHFTESMLQRRDLMRKLKLAEFQNSEFSRIGKGIRYQLSIVTGQLQFDLDQALKEGYPVQIHTLPQLEQTVSSHPEFHDHLMIDGIQKVVETGENLSIEFISDIQTCLGSNFRVFAWGLVLGSGFRVYRSPKCIRRAVESNSIALLRSSSYDWFADYNHKGGYS